MQNILIAEIKQEISTFNPVPSTEHDFVTHFGDEIVRVHRGLNSEMAGALDVFNQRNDIALKPTYSARAITSAGVLTATGWQHLASHFLETIQAAANAAPIHGVYFSMHGAMSAEGELDPEGAGDPEHVAHRLLVFQPVDVGRQFLRPDAVVLRHPVQRTVRIVGRAVQLGAVAGGQDGRLLHRTRTGQFSQRVGQ